MVERLVYIGKIGYKYRFQKSDETFVDLGMSKENQTLIGSKLEVGMVGDGIINGEYLNKFDIITKPKPKIDLKNIVAEKKVSEPKRETESSFDYLNRQECKLEKKGMFNYVSWTNCWKIVKKHDSKATFKIYQNENGFPCWTKKGVGSFVKIGVTIDDVEYVEMFPVLDNRNKAIMEDMLDVFSINTAIKKGLVKACAFAGVGLYVYEGEDLPEE